VWTSRPLVRLRPVPVRGPRPTVPVSAHQTLSVLQRRKTSAHLSHTATEASPYSAINSSVPRPRATNSFEIRLDSGVASPLQRQLYEGLRETIVLGRLPLGMRLPSLRALAWRLGISRNTVLFAYEELAADGWLSRKTGSGTRVAWRAQAVRFADPDGLSIDGLGLVQSFLSHLAKEPRKNDAG